MNVFKNSNQEVRQDESAAKGIFIVLEGTDGSGKGTQYELLMKRLIKAGYDVAAFDFPQYGEPSSYFVKQYLNGVYGDVDEVGPYTASLFYALDRYEAAPRIRDALNAGKVVIANRFSGSNMAHQGTKFDNADERRGYFIWLDNLEFEMLRIPRPNMSLVLRVPADIAQSMVDNKAERQYTDKKRDIHEADLNHLAKSVEVYDDLCQLFPKDFSQIDCVRGGQLLDRENISNLLWEKLSPLLPEPGLAGTKPTEATNAPTVNEVPLINKLENGAYEITDAGRVWLEDAVTNVTGNVYATKSKLESITAAAAMARLSRRGDDMRVTVLDEFADKVGKDDRLIQRVITAYGDDSVQQLVGQHMVIENASNLLTKKLEWGRLAAYLEQSTRYIYFDQKDAEGKYKYFVPAQFDNVTRLAYCQRMDQIFDLYSAMAHKLTDYVRELSNTPEEERDGAWKGATRAQACDAIRAVLPVATKATVGIFASGQALENLIMHLQADELAEAKAVGEQILTEARKIIPTFLERADKPERGGAAIAYKANTAKAMQNLAQEYLSDAHTNSDVTGAQLADYWPKNELQIVADMLYEHSDLPLNELAKTVDKWPYEQKAQVLKTYMGERLNRRHRPGRALEKVHYSWDILCDYGIFRDLQRHRMVDDLEWQQLTPRHGFDIPKLVEDAGLSEIFEQCFDISLELYSILQQAGYGLEAQYATLLGHRMRWKVTYNAREAFHLHELRTSPQGHPAYRKLVLEMHEKLAEVHPMLAGSMIFVNQDEDPALTRLAAERYSQFKLAELYNTEAQPKTVDKTSEV